MIVEDDGVHVDEGTIHAWLDGELDDEQSARLNAHIGACGACAARVAEARGLIAGASRVIGMLDETPSPIIRPAVTPTAGTDLSAWRLLRVTPARASIAAMLVVAVGIALTRGQLAREAPVLSRMQDSARLVTPASPAVATAAAVAPTADSVLSSAIARRLAAEQPLRKVEPAPGAAMPSPPAPAAPSPSADLADAQSKIMAGREAVASERVTSGARADRTRAGFGQQVLSDAATTGVATNAAKAADAAGASSPAPNRVLAADAIAPGQCYRVESASPAVWGSAHLPIIVAVDSTGVEARVLSPNGTDTDARAFLRHNGPDSALFVLRRIGYTGSMMLLPSTGTRTGTLRSSSAGRLEEVVVTPSTAKALARRDATPPAPSASPSGTVAQVSITARPVSCPSSSP